MKKFLIIFSLFIISLAGGCSKNGSTEIVCDIESISLPGSEGEYSLRVSVKGPSEEGTITAVSGSSWIKEINVTEENTVTFHYDSNPSEEPRDGILQLSYGNRTAVKNIPIVQDSKVYVKYALTAESLNDIGGTILISPNGDDKYYFGVAETEIYDTFINDECFLEYVAEQAEMEAEKEGIPLSDYLDRNITSGEYSYIISGLESNKEYVVFASDIDESGVPGGFMETMRFSTKDPIKIDLEVSVKGAVATLTADPAYDDRRYLLFALSSYECSDDESSVGEVLAEILKEEIKYITWQEGITVEEYVNGVTTMGKSSKMMELYQEYDYFGLAVCLDKEGNFSSEIFTVPFKTETVRPSDNEIKIEISDVTGTSAHYKVTTTNNDLYLFFIDKAEAWKEMPDEELISIIADGYPTTIYGRREGCEGDIKKLVPGTEYIAFAFGCEAFTPTTALTRLYFTTTADGNGIVMTDRSDSGPEPLLPDPIE